MGKRQRKSMISWPFSKWEKEVILVKVVVNNGQYKITIPKDIALAKGWSSETRLIVVMNAEGDIVLREIHQGGKIAKRK